MRLPTLTEIETSRSMIDAFGGYNHNLRIGESEFYDMKNLTSDHYPLLSPRKRRGTYAGQLHGAPCGLIEKDALCYVTKVGSNLHFVMNDKDYDLGMTDIDAEVERTMTSMGAYDIIMPDKIYFNTKDEDDFGKIEATYSNAKNESKTESAGYDVYNEVRFEICRADGGDFEVDCTSPEEPPYVEDEDGNKTEWPDGYTWLDTSSTPASMKVYSAKSGIWSSVATTYIKINSTGIGNSFNAFDGVKISGVTIDDLQDLNNTTVIYSKDESEGSSDWIVVVGIMNKTSCVQEDRITVERQMPMMDFVIESNNRLWGCRYGTNANGDIVNELYASKLGDFKNWNCFLGISTDSYYVSLGTDGQFTGAYSYLGMPVFFKEKCLHTVYGNFPAEYQVQDTACRGVQKGSHRSLAMVNEVLYYKSRSGICTYSGSLPTEISTALGEKSYSQASGCAHKGKYYVSMKDNATGEFCLFVCDPAKGMWHKEEDVGAASLKDYNLNVATHTPCFCSVDDEIYLIDSSGNIRSLFGTGVTDTEPVEWMAESGIIGCSSPDKKYISRVSIRLKQEIGAVVTFFIQYDSDGAWHPVCRLVGHNLRTHTLPIRPQRCDHFRLRINGVGETKIYSITKTMEQGSDF